MSSSAAAPPFHEPNEYDPCSEAAGWRCAFSTRSGSAPNSARSNASEAAGASSASAVMFFARRENAFPMATIPDHVLSASRRPLLVPPVQTARLDPSSDEHPPRALEAVHLVPET